jgi:hypothetical protein
MLDKPKSGDDESAESTSRALEQNSSWEHKWYENISHT